MKKKERDYKALNKEINRQTNRNSVSEQISKYLIITLKIKGRKGQPRGRVVKFVRSTSAAQGFTSSDPGCGHGTTHQAVLRGLPAYHNQNHSQLEYWGLWGEEKKNKEKTFRQDLISIFLKLFKNTREDGMPPKTFCEADITLISKPDKDNTKKESYRPVWL